MKSIDLSEYLGGEKPKAKRDNVAPAVRLAPKKPAAKHGEHAEEVVVMFIEHHCLCGRTYETPEYGDVMTRYGFYKRGKKTANIYRPYCEAIHKELPEYTEVRCMTIQKCRHCHGENS